MKPIEEPNEHHAWSRSLITLLERQHGVVGELCELARYQGTLIEAGRTEPLLGLLGKRQQLLDEFTAMQSELGGLTENLGPRLECVAKQVKHRIQTLIDEISGQLSDIMARDQEDQKSLEAARDRVKDELATTSSAQSARSAYTKASVTESRFADRQG